MQELNFLTEAYDHSEVIEKQLRPLISQIHSICQENRIPYLCAVASSCDPAGNAHVVNGSALLLGQEVTPPELVVANLAIQKSIPDAMKFGTMCVLTGNTSDQVDAPDDAGFADGPQPTVNGAGHA